MSVQPPISSHHQKSDPVLVYPGLALVYPGLALVYPDSLVSDLSDPDLVSVYLFRDPVLMLWQDRL